MYFGSFSTATHRNAPAGGGGVSLRRDIARATEGEQGEAKGSVFSCTTEWQSGTALIVRSRLRKLQDLPPAVTQAPASSGRKQKKRWLALRGTHRPERAEGWELRAES